MKKAAQRLAKEDAYLSTVDCCSRGGKVGVVETAAEFFSKRSKRGDRKRNDEVSSQSAKGAPSPEDRIR